MAQINLLHATSYFSSSQFNKTVFFCLLLALFHLPNSSLPQICIVHAAPVEAAKPANVKLPEGRWFWPDGGYLLQRQNIKKDGSPTATHLNSGPINVSRAEAAQKDGGLPLSVELRDIHYPFSTYTLKDDLVADRLERKPWERAL
ncbi:MAG: hypothetical protein HY789_04985 [Deltaproteobacteria bacterium]|nr:hypothetical protein [Deltaproteobacteria bacterium]